MAHDSLGTLAGDVSHHREKQRHLCPVSEPYAPVEVLPGYLRQGWTPDDPVITETHFFGGRRHSAIYFFTLRRDDAHIRKPVLENPVALRVVNNYRLKVTEAIGGNSDHGSTGRLPLVVSLTGGISCLV